MNEPKKPSWLARLFHHPCHDGHDFHLALDVAVHADGDPDTVVGHRKVVMCSRCGKQVMLKTGRQ